MNQKENNTEISFTWDSESEGYYKRHKLSNGQFCQIGFYRWNGSRSTEYHVAFAVADKKKNLNGWFNQTKDDNLTLRTTGRCGVEALFWARDMLLKFERYIFLRETEDTKTLQEVDKKISELHILRKSLEKMEIRKFQEKAKKNVGRCFILNGNYLRIIDIPREQYDLSGHCHFNPYQYPALYLGHGCDNDDIVPFYCDTVFSSILGESKNTRNMSFREISEEEFMVEFDRYVKELRDALLIGNSVLEEQG